MNILRKIRSLPAGPVAAVLILGVVFGEHAQPIGVFSLIGLVIITLKAAFSWISRLRKRRTHDPAYCEDDVVIINPATGLPMRGGVDAEGNFYGEDWSRW